MYTACCLWFARLESNLAFCEWNTWLQPFQAVARITSRTSCDIVRHPELQCLACRDVGKALSAKRGREVHKCSLERSCQELARKRTSSNKSNLQAKASTQLLSFHEACATLHYVRKMFDKIHTFISIS